MSKLWLYSVFHLNLAFSSIPQSHYPLIIDRCYWPLLDIADRLSIPLGLEATGYTLETLEQYDSSYVSALKKAWELNQIEFVGSSYTQSILPLCPSDVNQHNLKLGKDIYESLLGKQPDTAFINEQTYSSGLVDLYLDAGYKQLFMEWNNPARYNPSLKMAHYRPQKALNPDGTRSITVIWNDSIAFQKLQRTLKSEITQKEYLNYLSSHFNPQEERGFSFYGSDAEVIDYNPGLLEAEYLESEGNQDLHRLISLLEVIKSDSNYGWISPSGFTSRFPPSEKAVRLESPEYPLPCKKQPKYNPTRWAVSGREDIHLNSKCYKLFNQIQVVKSFKDLPVDSSHWRKLLEIWGSDLRTHTTEDKMTKLRKTSAALELKIDEVFSPYISRKSLNGAEVILWNPDLEPYQGVVTMEVQFPHGAIYGLPQPKKNAYIQGFQLESIGRYQDGSVRWVKATLMLELQPRVETSILWESSDIPYIESCHTSLSHYNQKLELLTESISLRLLLTKGGSIESLRFNKLDSRPWIGTIPHGYFDDIGLAADFYSGHMILESKNGEKATDLNQCTWKIPDKLDDYPIRIPIRVGVDTDIGSLWKTIYIYQAIPRIDLIYHFKFRDIAAVSARVGIMTALPEAFDLNSLSYSTINGGFKPEKFLLKGHTVTHSNPVSINVSAEHGVGATDGWISLEDKTNRIILKTYPHEAYAMPMVHFQESYPGYFLRILPSIGEFDDTSHTLWRGHHQVMFSWIGGKSSDDVYMPLPPVSLSANAKVLSV